MDTIKLVHPITEREIEVTESSANEWLEAGWLNAGSAPTQGALDTTTEGAGLVPSNDEEDTK